jgi:hypothetical protein
MPTRAGVPLDLGFVCAIEKDLRQQVGERW